MNKISKPKVVSKKLLIPFVLVTSLFVLWGFANAGNRSNGSGI
jgi:FHS family L-fucose permease-like MFS transporter